jgi:hypothetical protein
LSVPQTERVTHTDEATDDLEGQRVRCLCGKWWCYRSGDMLILRCKLCRRDIVITGENLKISYR